MRTLRLLLLTLWVVAGHYALPCLSQTIINGVPWYDQKGNAVNAHGAGIIYDNGRYWLFGEYKSDTTNCFPGFGCYSSDDLQTWRFERVVLPVQKSGLLGPNRVGERPKVLRCPKTGEYVMLAHADSTNYWDQHTIVATCKTVNGEYKLHGALMYKRKPMRMWDIGAFQDNDGKAYLLTLGSVYRLSDDYLTVDTLLAKLEGVGESPAMFKKDGIYFFLTSHLTSWERNDNFYYTATNPAGPWKRHGFFCPQGTLTWNSQTTFVLMLPNGTPMYMGDRWSFPHQGSSATYVWLPLTTLGDSLSIPQYWQVWNAATVKPVTIERALGGKTVKKVVGLNSNVKGMTKTVSFRGTRVALTGRTDSLSGYAWVKVVNAKGKEVYASYIDFYSKVPAKGILCVTPRLPRGNYRLIVSVTGEKPNWTDKRHTDYGARDYYVKADSLIVAK